MWYKIIIVALSFYSNIAWSGCADNADNMQYIGQVSDAIKCLNEEIVQLKKRLSTSSSTNSEVTYLPDLPKPKIEKTVTDNEIRYQVIGCKRESSVVCKLSISNLERDAIFTIHSYTKIFDGIGGQYHLSRVKIGNNYRSFGRSHADDRFSRNIIKKVRNPVELVFNNVSSEATRIAVLQLWNNSKKSVSIRDIAITH